MSLGQVIRQRREERGLTQDELSARAGISKPYLSNIETGKAKNPPTDGVLLALQRALGFEGGELMHLAHLARTPRDVRDEHELLQAEVQKLRGVLRELVSEAPRDESGRIDVEEARRRLEAGISTSKDGRGVPLDENVRTISAGAAVPVINNVAAGYPHHFTDLDYPPSVADEYIRVPDLHDPQAFAARVVGDSMEPDYREGDIVIFSPNTAPHNGSDCFVRFADEGETTFKRFYQDSERVVRLQPLNNRYPARTHPPEDITGLWPAVCRFQKLR